MSTHKSETEKILFLLESPNLSREEKLDYLTTILNELTPQKEEKQHYSLRDLRTYIEKNATEQESKTPARNATTLGDIYIIFHNNDIFVAKLIEAYNTKHRLANHFTYTYLTGAQNDSRYWQVNREINFGYGDIACCIPLIELLPLGKYNQHDNVSNDFIKNIYETIEQYLQENPLFIEQALKGKK